jgi:uncharacterized protein involved in exopolysaccharide biosynthesis
MQESDLNRSRGTALVRVNNEDAVLLWRARDLLSVAFRRKKVLLTCFCGLVLGVVLGTILVPREYESEAKILLAHERADPLVTPGAASQFAAHDSAVSGEELNSEVELIRSEDLLEKVVMVCKLAAPAKDKHTQQRNLAAAVTRLRSQLKVEVIRKSNILSITYYSSSPELSTRVVNTVVTSYLDKHVAIHNLSSELRFFDQQVAGYKGELEKATQALTTFSQSSGGAVSPATQRDAVLQRQNEFNATLQQTRSTIAETEERIRTLNKEAADTSPRITTQLRSADNPQLLQDLKATLLRLQLKRTELLSKYQATYPSVLELDQEIGNTEAALSSAESSPLHDQTTDLNPTHQWIDSELTKAQAELRALEARASNLVGIVERYDHQAHYMDEQQLKYEGLVRDAKSAEDNYLLYVRKREETRITNALDQLRILNVTVIEPPTHPYLPRHSSAFYLVTGLLLAIFATVGLLLGLERANNTFSTPRDLEYFTKLPVLAAVPVEHTLSLAAAPQPAGPVE